MKVFLICIILPLAVQSINWEGDTAKACDFGKENDFAKYIIINVNYIILLTFKFQIQRPSDYGYVWLDMFIHQSLHTLYLEQNKWWNMLDETWPC